MDDTSVALIAALERGDDTEADRLTAVLDTVTALQALRDNRPGRIAEEAHDLANYGIPVFPIKPAGKHPLTPHGFHDASADHGTITAWWQQWPDANLGIPTGVAFDVVDIDGPEGMAAMYNGPEPLVELLTVLGVALTTRDGGRHLYVPPRPDLGNRTALAPGVDYRAGGGYVVAPPSVGANGRRYQWLTHPMTSTPALTLAGAA